MTLARVAESLLTHGRIKRAYLGAQTQRVKLPKATQEELGQEYGLLIISVGTHSPAEKSGLTMGDTLVTFVDLPIISSDSLMAQLTSDRIGQKNPTRILRSGKLEMISLVLGEQP
jgi:S1-C subfamily serine protease